MNLLCVSLKFGVGYYISYCFCILSVVVGILFVRRCMKYCFLGSCCVGILVVCLLVVYCLVLCCSIICLSVFRILICICVGVLVWLVMFSIFVNGLGCVLVLKFVIRVMLVVLIGVYFCCVGL